MGLSLRRALADRLAFFLSLIFALLCVFPLLDIIWQVTVKALPALSITLFTTTTQGVSGGLLNALTGTLLLVALATVIAAPLGILGGVYLAEFNPQGFFGTTIRFTSDVLAGVPSIVLGYFGFVTMVLGLGWKFSALAGAITLAIMSLPYIMRSTELALSNVPQEMREASLALGADQTITIQRILLRLATPGILTGVLLAISISLGETAPLIFTAGWSNYVPTGQLIGQPVGYLTYVIWNFIEEPFASAHHLAYASAFILMVFILVLNVVVRRVFGRTNPGMQRGG